MTPASRPRPPARRRWLAPACWSAAAAGLAVVFMLYARPDLMFTVSQAMWACFGIPPR